MSTPPIVHDSDRKAMDEIDALVHNYRPLNRNEYSRNERKNAALLIIARHHAEERAAVEKVREALEKWASWYDPEVHSGGPIALSRAALTALRTASQSPTT